MNVATILPWELRWTEFWNFLTHDHTNVLCPNLGASISKLTNQPTNLPTNLLTYLLTYLLTNSMDQSPFWEANTSASSQCIPHVSWVSNVHCRVHNSMLLVRTVSQITPVHVLSKYFLKIHFNITLPSAPRFSKLSLSIRVSHKISCAIPRTCHMRQREQYDSSFIHINEMSRNASRLPRIVKTADHETDGNKGDHWRDF